MIEISCSTGTTRPAPPNRGTIEGNDKINYVILEMDNMRKKDDTDFKGGVDTENY